ncbi:DUF2752 domain-containing protein [bacterium]|nr:DUF2752 domain-containing protein [bacterium]
MKLKHFQNPECLLKLAIGLILLTVATSGLLYHLLDINLLTSAPRFSICPFHFLTHKPCPGCGILRALISIGQLQFHQALQYNLFSFPLLAVMVSYLLPWQPLQKIIQPHWYKFGLIVILIFGILRLCFPELYPV